MNIDIVQTLSNPFRRSSLLKKNIHCTYFLRWVVFITCLVIVWNTVKVITNLPGLQQLDNDLSVDGIRAKELNIYDIAWRTCLIPQAVIYITSNLVSLYCLLVFIWGYLTNLNCCSSPHTKRSKIIISKDVRKMIFRK